MLNLNRIFFVTLVLLAATVPLSAQTQSYSSEIGFRSENDSYLAQGQDRYYTNGLSLHFRNALNQSKLKNTNLNKVIWELEGGQKIYNPQSGSIPSIEYVDRPFAGYLYGGGSLHFLYNSESNLKLGIQLGTIGPAAKGKEAQELLHNTFGFYKVNGWQWQLRNEFGINTSISYDKLISRLKSEKLDFSLSSYLNAGNTFSGAGAGILFRLGAINPLFSSSSTQSIVSNHARSIVDKEFFLYAKPMVHFIAYDATIQGGIFLREKGPIQFEQKPLVFSQQMGIMYAKNRWTVDFSAIFKSKEIKSIAKSHQYGSFALFYRIN